MMYYAVSRMRVTLREMQEQLFLRGKGMLTGADLKMRKKAEQLEGKLPIN